MTADSPVFVDTNVLVYFTFAHFAEHQGARRRLAECESLPATLRTSRQVLREFLAVATRPGFLSPLPSVRFLAQAVQAFENWFQIAAEDAQVTGLLSELVENPGPRANRCTTPTSWPPCADTGSLACSPTTELISDAFRRG